MKILLDTDTCIYLIKKRYQSILDHLTKYKTGEVGISSITYSELIHGVFNSSRIERNLEALQEFILPIEIIPFDDEAAYTYGQVKAHLKSKGNLIGPMDLLIGSHALSLKIPLVTNNEREFNRIPDLHLINWIEKGV